MTRNPFRRGDRSPIMEPDHDPVSLPEPEAEDWSDLDSNLSGEERATEYPARGFVKQAVFASMMFLIVMFFVFREIQHNRELYRMSRLVAAAEAQTRQWQERQRLEEARRAGLIAVLHREPIPTRTPRVMNAAYILPKGGP